MIIQEIDIQKLDQKRIQLQEQLDQRKTTKERNQLGQFATPPELAQQVVQATQALLTSPDKIRFLDPAFGTGAFYGALRNIFSAEKIELAQGYEIDTHYGIPAQNLWSGTRLQLELKDFSQVRPPLDQNRANFLICNPPYVRHHHLLPETKKRLKTATLQATGIKLSGLSGLYCYFLLLADQWLADDGVACWLIPSEFMDVNYGQQIKEYLLSNVELIRIHRFDPIRTQFDDALVSSAVVWLRKPQPGQKQHKIQFSFGTSLAQPSAIKYIEASKLSPKEKWSNLATTSTRQSHGQPSQETLRLSDLFAIKRGIATGANKFFILTHEQVQKLALPQPFLTPIFPSPRYVTTDEVQATPNGLPILEKQLFLLNCDQPEQMVRQKYPTLWHYLEAGIEAGFHERYLCQHRSPWYIQDRRSPAPLLCTYMGRSQKPFRFILNHSQATAANVYLMLYPKPILQTHLTQNSVLLRAIWERLTQIDPQQLMAEGRVYGGGLHKLEPKELSNAPLEGIREIIPGLQLNGSRQMSLF